jgi:hypothetical protein
MTNLSQTEKALSKGADCVISARGEVKSKCNTLSDRVNDMMAVGAARAPPRSPT